MGGPELAPLSRRSRMTAGGGPDVKPQEEGMLQWADRGGHESRTGGREERHIVWPASHWPAPSGVCTIAWRNPVQNELGNQGGLYSVFLILNLLLPLTLLVTFDLGYFAKFQSGTWINVNTPYIVSMTVFRGTDCSLANGFSMAWGTLALWTLAMSLLSGSPWCCVLKNVEGGGCQLIILLFVSLIE